MVVLVTNDDGIDAEGINLLFEALSSRHDVYMIAPNKQRSACSNAITMHSSLKLKKHDSRRYSCDGFPADCTNLGLYGNIIPKPDLVVSGINHGANMGDDVFYSGTVAGARSAYIHGVNSIAVSYDSFFNYDYLNDAAAFAAEVADKMCGSHKRFFININYPNLSRMKIAGIKYASLGRRKYVDGYKMNESSGEIIMTLDGYVDSYEKEGTDVTEIKKGFIVISPLGLDNTDYIMLEHLAEKDEQFTIG